MSEKNKIVKHPILRTLLWAACIIILSVFAAYMMLNIFTRHNEYYTVPDFAGLNLKQAQDAATEGRLVLELVDSLYVPAYDGGVILEQRPASGSKVKSGRRVFLTVNSFNQRMVKVPYVAGYSLRQAKNNLELSGLNIEELIYKEDIATNNVLEQYYKDEQITIETDMQLEYGSSITLVVGAAANAPMQNMPKLIGLSLREAQSRLWELGLNVGRIVMDLDVNMLNRADAKVYTQSEDHATYVKLGSKVDLAVTLETEKVTVHSLRADSAYKARLEYEKLLEIELDSLARLSEEPLTAQDSIEVVGSAEAEIMNELMNFFD